MDSPIRQQLKRNDYQRHKLFRKMNRRKKAKKEQELKAAEKELRRKLRIPRYEDGKPKYNIRTNDGTTHNFSFDEEGNTVLDNGTVGSQLLDNVIVRPQRYSSAFDPFLLKTIDDAFVRLVNNGGGTNTGFSNLIAYFTNPQPYYGFRDLSNNSFSPSPRGMNIPKLALSREVRGMEPYIGNPVYINGRRFGEDGNLYNMFFLDRDTLKLPSTAQKLILKYSNGNTYSMDQEGLQEFWNSGENSGKKRDIVYDAGHFTMQLNPNEAIMLDSHDTGNPIYDSRIKEKPYFILRVPIVYGNYSNQDLYALERMIDVYPKNMHNDLREFDFTNALRKAGGLDPLDILNVIGYKNGKASGIHIKPENRGKFTALKKRTGHSASWFKKNGTPALKKMATFALNSRKWHHK